MSKTFHCPKCDKDFTLSDEEWERHERVERMVDAMDSMAGIDSLMSMSGRMSCPNCKEYVKVTPVEGGCFIATAACGTDQAEDVVRLREFRERVLRPTAWGRAFIAGYERCSPPLARFIGRWRLTRLLTRKAIVCPLSCLAKQVLHRNKNS